MAYEAGREHIHRLSPSYVVGTILIDLPTFSQCGQISQSLQAWAVESINPVFFRWENRPREVQWLLQVVEPSWSSCLTFWLQMLRCRLSYSYCWDTALVQQTGEQKNILPKSSPRNGTQECSPCWPSETLTTLLISYYSIIKDKKKRNSTENPYGCLWNKTQKKKGLAILSPPLSLS